LTLSTLPVKQAKSPEYGYSTGASFLYKVKTKLLTMFRRVAQIGKLREVRELREQARGLISREYYDWLLWRIREISKQE